MYKLQNKNLLTLNPNSLSSFGKSFTNSADVTGLIIRLELGNVNGSGKATLICLIID